jgi:hypothetical protein
VQSLTSKYEALQDSIGSAVGTQQLLQLAPTFQEAGDGASEVPRDPPEVIRNQEAAQTAAAKAHLVGLLQVCRECNLSVDECDRLRLIVEASTADNLIEVCCVLYESLCEGLC